MTEFAPVDFVTITGEAPPGIFARDVPFNETSYFQATLAVASCGVAFHFLTDSEYATFQANGRLPPFTVDCNRTQVVIQTPIRHMVTVYSPSSGGANLSYEINVEFFGEHHPYALLSIPGALLGIGATISIAATMLSRGTAKLSAEYPKLQQRK